jgi:hypothetical protein
MKYSSLLHKPRQHIKFVFYKKSPGCRMQQRNHKTTKKKSMNFQAGMLNGHDPAGSRSMHGHMAALFFFGRRLDRAGSFSYILVAYATKSHEHP